ncbi:hypothetical protein ACHAXR_013509 [Thalassiosira sp. AJA248-18]
MSSNTLANDTTLLSGKRSQDDDIDYLPPPSKREKLGPAYYFQEETGVQEVQEEAVDFAMELLQRDDRHDAKEPSLEFSVAPHRASIGLRSCEFVSQICATVKACELPSGDAFARAPVDIVVALDVSGSMASTTETFSCYQLSYRTSQILTVDFTLSSFQRVEKLDLCKTTLNLLLRELHHNDRFCLISFSDEAKIEVPMLKVNDEQKLKAMHTIQHLHVRGRTNIASAISLAAQVANAVKDPNKVRSVFLLTDGIANVGFTEAKDLMDLTGIFVENGHNPHTPPISLHTFGYGEEPDSKLLQSMAKVTSGGSFYSVRNNAQVASAFGDAIGGILSVVAQNVIMTISIPEEAAKNGAEIISVHHDKTREISEGVFRVALGDVYAEETRDIMFEVTLASPKTDGPNLIPHATIELSYVDTIMHSFVGPLSGTAIIARPNNDDLGWPNKYVAVQWMRVRTAKTIAEAERFAKMGELDNAKNQLTNWIEEIEREKFELGIGSKDDPLLDQLLVDLTDCLDMLKGANYNAYVENELGVRMQAHFSQRCSEPGNKRNVYRTAQKSLRAKAFDKRV